MKTRRTPSWFMIFSLLVSAVCSQAADPSAFDLIKEGNRHVGEDAKDKVVQIRSEKSIGSMTPITWYVVYYDPDATFKATEVKFVAGKKTDVKRPPRLPEPIVGKDKKLDQAKFKIDSDKAIKIASQEPGLKNLTLKATQLTLTQWGEDDAVVWKVRLWAAKLKNPNDDAKIGEVIISAEDGKVLKSDLKPNKVD